MGRKHKLFTNRKIKLWLNYYLVRKRQLIDINTIHQRKKEISAFLSFKKKNDAASYTKDTFQSTNNISIAFHKKNSTQISDYV